MPPGRLQRLGIAGVCTLFLAGASGAASFAQDKVPAADPLPPWVVLVLQPISGERVRPVTGVVISVTGLVIVPLDFAAVGDQIIVLDGGTDIIANGRAAKVQQQFPLAGLTVLSAPGLKRQPASLSSVPLQNDATIRLAAFPPAEMISQGAATLWVPAKIVVTDTGISPAAGGMSITALAAGQSLPNVSGPLLDECGNLVGFSSAEGVQSMETSKAPAYLWNAGLLPVLRELSVELPATPCPVITLPAVEAPPVPVETEVIAAADPPVPDAVEETPVAADDLIVPSGIVTSGQATAVTANPVWLKWLRLAGALVLALVLGGVAWILFRRRSRAGAPIASLLKDADTQIPRAKQTAQAESTLADCVLEINGRLHNGAPFKSRCEINSAAIDAVIGRGAVDIVIDSQGVQREHARLSGSSDQVTITDLGSSHGTWINRVPCLKGEIMYVGAEDTIFLGDVSFQITITSL